jgi:transketolase
MLHLGFEPERLGAEDIAALEQLRVQCATDIVTMTTLATCGHPGGSLSSLHFLLLLYSNCNVRGNAPLAADRDRIFISHGHISPGTYSVLSAFGFCDRDEAILTFRRFGSPFGGHVEIGVPGVEWNTGNLGQGFSAAVGCAIGARLADADPKQDLRQQRGARWRVVACMGDGEQQKGQISEARRLAVKYGCGNLIGIVDLNKLQIGGKTAEIMPQDVVAGWRADGWNVLEADGHDWQALYAALRAAYRGEAGDRARPTVLIARTVMSKGVGFIEDNAKWHGSALSPADCKRAISLIGGEDRLDDLTAKRKALPPGQLGHHFPKSEAPRVEVGPPIVYALDKPTDCRSAYGAFMKDLAERNNGQRVKVAAFSADLEGSVKLEGFHAASPAGFIEGGIQEHNSATSSGRLSKDGFVVFFSTFGIFGVTETFNQQRLNGFNRSNLKLVCTHCGTDVGEDGPTHQVVDYVGLLRSTFDWEVYVPGDPNQCDRILRAVVNRPGAAFVGMGRSKMPAISTGDGAAPFYGAERDFVPGKADVLRDGDAGAILAFGPMVVEAVAAHEIVRQKTGRRVRVLNMASLRPFDGDAVLAAARTGYVLTAEDHHPDTGLGGLVATTLADAGVATRLERAGIGQWPMSGAPPEIFRAYGLDAAGLAARVVRALT